jgi:hypothetical protein
VFEGKQDVKHERHRQKSRELREKWEKMREIQRFLLTREDPRWRTNRDSVRIHWLRTFLKQAMQRRIQFVGTSDDDKDDDDDDKAPKGPKPAVGSPQAQYSGGLQVIFLLTSVCTICKIVSCYT